jgi:hypothetical protein
MQGNPWLPEEQVGSEEGLCSRSLAIAFVGHVYWNSTVFLVCWSCHHWCFWYSHNSVWRQVPVAFLLHKSCSTTTTFLMAYAMFHISCSETNRNRRWRDVWQSCARRMFRSHKMFSPHPAQLLPTVHEFSRLTRYASSCVIVLVDVLVFTTDMGSTDEWNPVSAYVHSLLTCGSSNNMSLRR